MIFIERVNADLHDAKYAFAWCEKGPKYDAEKLMVQLVDGAAYGHPDRVRVNLVGDIEDVRELAYRTHRF